MKPFDSTSVPGISLRGYSAKRWLVDILGGALVDLLERMKEFRPVHSLNVKDIFTVP